MSHKRRFYDGTTNLDILDYKLCNSFCERLHYRAGKLVGENLPKCAVRQFEKQLNQSKPGKHTNAIKDKAGILSAEQLFP